MRPALLPPIADAAQVVSWAWQNFTRIIDALSSSQSVHGSTLITGSLAVDTGLASVDNVSVSLRDAPSAGRAFVRALPVGVGSPSEIEIFVYKDDYTLSATPTNVSWIATGEE